MQRETDQHTTGSITSNTLTQNENEQGKHTGQTQKDTESQTSTTDAKRRLVDTLFFIIVLFNALCLIGVVGGMEWGRIGLLRGSLLCTGHLAVCVAATYWGIRDDV